MQDKKWLGVLVLALLSVGANFWGFPVYVLDEAKNAACAMEMLQRGDWVTPTFNGQLRTDKPPLHYFFMMGSYALFGVTPFAARLFSVVMGLLTIASVYFFTKRMEGERVAFFAAMVMLSSLYLVIQFHLAVPDPYFICFLTLCWLLFAYGRHTGEARYYYLSYTALGLAFMAKGPAAVALSGIVYLGFLWASRNLSWKSIQTAKPLAAVMIFLVIVAPWWIAVFLQTDGEWVRDFFWGHNVGRFLAPYEDHSNVPGAAFMLFFIALLPLSIYLPMAIYRGWAERLSRPLIVLSIVATGTVLIFFSVSRTLLPNYIGPAVPFGAILIGYAVDRHLQRYTTTSRRLKAVAMIVLLFFLILIPVLQSVIAGDFWIGDMSELALLFLPWPVGAGLAWWLLTRSNLRGALIAYLLSFWAMGMLFFYVGVPTILARNPVASSLTFVKATDREVIGYRFFNPAYIFNLRRTLLTYWTPDDVRNYSAGKRVMIVTRKEYASELLPLGFKVVFEQPYLFEGSIAVILVNDPE